MRILADRDALLAWADADGAVFDESVELLSGTGKMLRFGERIGGAGPSFWHERAKFVRFWSSATEKLRIFTIAGDAVSGAASPGPVDEVRIVGSSLQFRVARRWTKLTARTSFTMRAVGTTSRRKVPRLSATELTALGSMRIMPPDLPGDVYNNWVGSGEMFGSANLRRINPARVPKTSVLEGAWWIVPHGAKPDDRRGVWIVGRAEGGSSYVDVKRCGSGSEPLWLATISGLRDVEYATCGNVLLTGAQLATFALPSIPL